MAVAHLYDVDGTLSPYKGNGLLQNVKEVIDSYRFSRQIGFATNQAGAPWNKLLVNGGEQYPTIGQVADRLFTIASLLSATKNYWFVSLYDERLFTLGHEEAFVWETLHVLRFDLVSSLGLRGMDRVRVFATPPYRKPLAGLYWSAFAAFLLASRDDLRIIGDQKEDKIPADDNGFHFEWAWQHFGWPEPEQKNQ